MFSVCLLGWAISYRGPPFEYDGSPSVYRKISTILRRKICERRESSEFSRIHAVSGEEYGANNAICVEETRVTEESRPDPEQGFLQPTEEISLFYRRWKPTGTSHGRNLLIVHGACEHGGRFFSLAGKAAAAGWNVVTPDLRGHGRSTGLVVHVDDFNDYLRDLKTVVESHGLEPEKTAIIGCSMGGLVTIRFQQWWYREFGSPASQMFYLIAPLLGIRHPIETWKKLAARMLARYRPQTTFRSTIQQKQLTHNQELICNRSSDSYMRNHVTASWYLESTQAMQDAWEQPEMLNVNTRVFQGGGDTIVDPWAAKAWADRVNRNQGRELIQFHCLPGWYHELMNENEGREFEDLLLRLLAEDMQLVGQAVNGVAHPSAQAVSSQIPTELSESEPA